MPTGDGGPERHAFLKTTETVTETAAKHTCVPLPEAGAPAMMTFRVLEPLRVVTASVCEQETKSQREAQRL